MSTQVISCQPDDQLDVVWSTMKDKGLQSVPIVDGQGKPIGLLSEVEYEEELLKHFLMCVGYR